MTAGLGTRSSRIRLLNRPDSVSLLRSLTLFAVYGNAHCPTRSWTKSILINRGAADPATELGHFRSV
jgi:hypothetical protein